MAEEPAEIPLASFITKQFLESHIAGKIVSFNVENGTKPGDNFMSVLYSISAEVEKSSSSEQDHATQKLHFLLKCYPTHPSRQKYLNKGNLFWNELSFYKELARDLVQFQTELVGLPPARVITPALPPFFGGKAVDYSKVELTGNEIYTPLDNYILMEDLRKSALSPFQMADAKAGLDVDHMKLAFHELATIHALSWVYKNKAGLDLGERYPFLRKASSPEKRKMWMGILAENANLAVQAIDSDLGDRNNLSKAISKFINEAEMIIQYFNEQDESSEQILRGKLRRTETSERIEAEILPPWRVICHGDCWVNNLLFQYNKATGKPDRVVLIDFPLAKLGCPTLDLACLVYTSTRREFRQTYLKTCLELYHERFVEVCQVMSQDALPPLFSVEVLIEKFHVSKLVGFLIALISLPLNLIDKDEDDADLEKMEKECTMSEMFQQASSLGGKGSLFKEWVMELAQEMYEEGVI